MAINLDNFVEIKFKHALNSKFSGSRNVCTLILFDDNIGEEKTYEEYKKGMNVDIENKYSVYLNSFFNNTNDKNCILKIIVRKVPKAQKGVIDYKTPFVELLENELKYSDIIVASNLEYDVMKDIRQNYTPSNTINEKIFLAYKPCDKDSVISTENIENFVIKADSSIKYDACKATLVTYGGVTLYELVSYTYTETEDTTFQEGKTYYKITGGSGTEEDPYIYTPQQVTVGDPIPSGEHFFERTGAIYERTSDTELVTGKTYYIKLETEEYQVYENQNQPYEIVGSGQTPGYLVDIEGYRYTMSKDIVANETKKYYLITNMGSSTTTYPYKGIEMTIGAYLTQINVNRYESVKDYCFTKEVISDISEDNPFKPVDDNLLAQRLMSRGYNFIGELVDATRNLGGNDSASYSVVNQFMLICLAQELSERLYSLLIQKIKYNTSGLNQISTTLVDTLQKYVDNGYLSTDKIWENDDLYYDDEFLIVRKGTPLSMGYKVFICPFSSLTPEEYKQNKLPNIFVLVADSYGIRKVKVDGTTF